jgi:prephenate dehydrogenase
MKITLLGAGGKMGGRITANLQHLSQYQVDYVEASEERRKQMADAGVKTTPMEEALGRTEAVILGVPDRLIGKITHDIVPKLKPGTIVLGLDPAAAYAGVMPKRDDITYFIAHPISHPHPQRSVERDKSFESLVPTRRGREVPVVKMEKPDKERKAAIHRLSVSARRIHRNPVRLEFQMIRHPIKFVAVNSFLHISANSGSLAEASAQRSATGNRTCRQELEWDDLLPRRGWRTQPGFQP